MVMAEEIQHYPLPFQQQLLAWQQLKQQL